MMARDPILEEIYKVREQILAEYHGDTASYLRDAQARLIASGRPIAKIKQRTIRCTGRAKSGELPVESQSSPLSDR
jgi:hypothetical protein